MTIPKKTKKIEVKVSKRKVLGQIKRWGVAPPPPGVKIDRCMLALLKKIMISLFFFLKHANVGKSKEFNF